MINPRQRPPVVWGFPAGYSPNAMHDRCEVCRNIQWQARPTESPDLFAWSCIPCSNSAPGRVVIPD